MSTTKIQSKKPNFRQRILNQLEAGKSVIVYPQIADNRLINYIQTIPDVCYSVLNNGSVEYKLQGC